MCAIGGISLSVELLYTIVSQICIIKGDYQQEIMTFEKFQCLIVIVTQQLVSSTVLKYLMVRWSHVFRLVCNT